MEGRSGGGQGGTGKGKGRRGAEGKGGHWHVTGKVHRGQARREAGPKPNHQDVDCER